MTDWISRCEDCLRYPCCGGDDYRRAMLIERGCLIGVKRDGVLWIGEEVECGCDSDDSQEGD